MTSEDYSRRQSLKLHISADAQTQKPHPLAQAEAFAGSNRSTVARAGNAVSSVRVGAHTGDPMRTDTMRSSDPSTGITGGIL